MVEITNRKNELIKEISKYLVSIRDCPAEDFGVDLDCENNCSIEDELIIKCWIKYFESKLKND